MIRIVRKIAQYFHPQRQTQVMNEGWATFWHYTLLNTLYDEGRVSDGFILEFLQSHTNVIYQPPYNSKWYSSINPYALGFNMWRDLQAHLRGPQRRGPRVVPGDRRVGLAGHLRLRHAQLQGRELHRPVPVAAAHARVPLLLGGGRRQQAQAAGGPDPRRPGLPDPAPGALADQYNLGSREPNIQVWNMDRRGDRALTLRYFSYQRRPLHEDFTDVLGHVAHLWGFPVRLEEQTPSGQVKTLGQTG